MQARRGVLFFTAGSYLVGRRNAEKSKRTKYCVADKVLRIGFRCKQDEAFCFLPQGATLLVVGTWKKAKEQSIA